MGRKRGRNRKREERSAEGARPAKKKRVAAKGGARVPDARQRGGGGEARGRRAGAGRERGERDGGDRGRKPARERGPTVEGRVSLHQRGFGFVVDREGREADVFLSPAELAGVMDGDVVRVEVERGRDGRLSGRLLSILERAHRKTVGVFRRGPHGTEVIPDGATFRQRLVVEPERRGGRRPHGARRDRGDAPRPEPGEVVEVEILEYPSRFRPGLARVLEVLGEEGDPEVEIERIIRRHGLPFAFPDEVVAEAEAIPTEVDAREARGRRDLRDLPIVTIDGETARDFDDAVFTREEADGVLRLWVSIADVAHYVQDGAPLDNEARERGTSVYFPTRVIPMLPERLSNGICSLNPNVDRLTLTAEITVDRAGRVLTTDFYESVIRSAARLTYTKVAAVLRGERVKEIERLRPHILLMGTLMKRLREARRRRGSIDFDLPEPEILIDITTGEPESIVRSERNDAHRLIEEMMIAANEAVARWFEERRLPTIFRVHAGPDPAKIEAFAALARTFGFRATIDAKITPLSLAQFVDKIAGKPYERALNTLLLRSMARAEYSERNVGHYGLASGAYLHFTSPIRRYPDLIVHRLLKGHLRRETRRLPDAARLADIARSSSAAERLADQAEYDVVDYWRARFMLDKVGEEYEGIVSGVTEFGVFVELLDFFVEGMIRASEISGDYFILSDAGHALVGKKSGLTFAIGDRMRVAVESVNLSEGRIDFRLVEKLPRG
jgi:ribonuclease R